MLLNISKRILEIFEADLLVASFRNDSGLCRTFLGFCKISRNLYRLLLKFYFVFSFKLLLFFVLKRIFMYQDILLRCRQIPSGGLGFWRDFPFRECATTLALNSRDRIIQS